MRKVLLELLGVRSEDELDERIREEHRERSKEYYYEHRATILVRKVPKAGVNSGRA